MFYKSVTLESVEVVSLNLAKEYFKILDNSEDTIIQYALNASVAVAEQYTNRALKATDYLLTLQEFMQEIELDKTPFNHINKIEYTNTNGDEVEITDYTVVKNQLNDSAIVALSKPSDFKENLKIYYNAGYQETPAQIVQFILAQALTLYEQRHFGEIEGKINTSTKSQFVGLLKNFRKVPV